MDGGFESRLEDLKQEEIVNIGLKELVLNAFKR